MATHNISFTQINLHHCKGATDLLSCSLSKKQTMIALIQEPYVYQGKIRGLDIKGYLTIQSNNSRIPRACIIISNELKASLLPQFITDDLVAMILNIKEAGTITKIAVASAYLPYDSVQQPPGAVVEELVSFCQSQGLPLLLCCDANSHHTVWGSTDINSRGQSLIEFISATNLSILNRGNEPTFFNTRRQEVIDITLCSQQIEHQILNWRVSEEVSLSDHRYIKFNLAAKVKITQWFRNSRQANWSVYQNELVGKFGQPTEPTTYNELDGMVDSLNKVLLSAFETACPLKRTSNKRIPLGGAAKLGNVARSHVLLCDEP